MKTAIILSAAAALAFGVHSLPANARECTPNVPTPLAGNTCGAGTSTSATGVARDLDSGKKYRHKVKFVAGNVAATGTLLDGSGAQTKRKASAGGGNCPSAFDLSADANFGGEITCEVAVAFSPTKYRITVD
jgi:hypothetical protein